MIPPVTIAPSHSRPYRSSRPARPARSGGPDRAGVEHVVGDLGDASSYAPALEGADALFTLAGYAGLAGTLEALVPSGAAVALLSSSAAPSGDRDNAVARYHLESEDLV